MPDHRAGYSPAKLLINKKRKTDRYDVAAAVADYLKPHPEAEPEKVWKDAEHALPPRRTNT